jgi:hypothetical protein
MLENDQPMNFALGNRGVEKALNCSVTASELSPSRQAEHRDAPGHREHRFHDHRQVAHRRGIQTMAPPGQNHHNVEHGWLCFRVQESVGQPYPNTTYNHPLFVLTLAKVLLTK